MIEQIQSLVSAISDRQKVMRALTLCDQPWVKLSAADDTTSVAIWLKDGQHLVHARVMPSGQDGYLALWSFFKLHKAKFALELVDNGEAGGRTIEFKLSDVLSDEKRAVARLSSAALAELSMDNPDSTITNMPSVGSLQTPESTTGLDGSQPARSESQPPVLSNPTQQSSPQAAPAVSTLSETGAGSATGNGKTADGGAGTSAAAVWEAALAARTSDVVTMDFTVEAQHVMSCINANDELTIDVTEQAMQLAAWLAQDVTGQTRENTPDMLVPDYRATPVSATAQPDMAELHTPGLPAPDHTAAPISATAQPGMAELHTPGLPAPDHTAAPRQATIKHSAIFRGTPSQTLVLPAVAPDRQQDNATAESTPPASSTINRLDGSSTTSFNLPAEQLTMLDIDNLPLAKVPTTESQPDGFDKGMSSLEAQEIAAQERIRRELEEAARLQTSSEGFSSFTPDLVGKPETEDKLVKKRKEQFEALAEFYADKPDAFEPTKTSALNSGQETLDAQQKRILGIVSYQSDPYIFSETDPELAKVKVEEPLKDIQKRVLEIVAAETNPVEFHQIDPVLALEGSLPPQVPKPSSTDPEAKASEESESQPSTDAASQPLSEAALAAAAAAAATAALTNRSGSGLADNNKWLPTATIKKFSDWQANNAHHHIPGYAAEEAPARTRIPTAVYIAGIIGIVLLPAVILAANHFGKQSNDELSEHQAAAAVAKQALDQESIVAKPTEPFRMPEGGSGVGSPPPARSNPSTPDEEDISKANRDQQFEWHPPAHPQAPLTAVQEVDAGNAMQKADGFMAAGYSDRAASLYLDLLHRYPTDAQVRVKTAQAYVAMRQYRQAYAICVAGLDICQTSSDFDLLVSTIREIPSKL